MLKKLNVLIPIGLLVGGLTGAASAADRGFVVHLKGNANPGIVAARHGMTVTRSLSGSGSGLHVLSAPKGQDVWSVIQSLATDPAVQAAEADAPMLLPGMKASAQVHPASATPPAFPIDGTLTRYYTGFAAQGYINQPAAGLIKISDAHKVATGAGKVAVIDTGVDLFQPVLFGSVVPGWDFVNNVPGGQERADVNQETTPILDQETTPILDSRKYPAYGHGTMVAGLIHLVAPGAKILPVRTFGADGTATISQIVAAIYYAVDNGAKVINMSFSTKVPSDSLRAALDFANSRGVICVAAAGNDGQAEIVFPASYGSVIDVASTNNADVRSLFSNYGSEIALAAPGEAVITTYPGLHYAEVWGTSFSTPLVAGGAALLVDVKGNVTPAQARQAITQAIPIGQELGAGELNVYQAVSYLAKRGGGN